jgi:two-component system cell cycle sensor histidine kinase/response regulator CckA
MPKEPVILILEDNEQARFVIRAMLENAGYGVVEAASEPEAIAVCGRMEQRIDLLVSDVILSSAKGTDAAERISALRPGLPILFISGYGVEDLVSRGLLDSDRFPSTRVSFLQKPFQPQLFLDHIEELIAGQ